MSKPDFTTMRRAELRQYILNHRENNDAFQIYLDRFTSKDTVVFPAPQTIEDLENFPELHKQNLERLRKQT